MRTSGQDPISKSIPIVASAYARKFGIKIGIGGGEAFTNGSHIQLPAIPEDYPYKDALWGFLAHEASHVRYTDFSVAAPNDYQDGLENSLEDGRIEIEFIKVFPGARQTLDEALRLFVHQDKMQKLDGSEHPAQILSVYILYWVRNQWRGQSILDDHYVTATNAMLSTFPKEVVAELDNILAEAPSLRSSSDVQRMAERILKLFKDESSQSQPDEKPEDGGGDPEQKKQGDSGESQDSSNGNESGGNKDSQNSKSSDPSGDQKDDGKGGQGGQPRDETKADEDQSGSSGGSDQKGEGESSEAQKSSESSDDQKGEKPSGSGQPNGSNGGNQKAQNVKLVRNGSGKHTAHDIFAEIKEDLGAVAKGNPQRSVMLPPDVESVGSLSKADTDELESRARGTTVSLRKQLMALVQSTDKVQKRYETRGRKVDSRRLKGVTGGDYRVFRRDKRAKKVNTAVHILLDASGSMRNSSRIAIANEASLAIAQALEAIPRVSVAVTAFKEGLTEPVYEMLQHNQTARANAGRFAIAASGGTPMAPALWHAARDLCNRKEERKIVMVITDGLPAQPDQCQNVISLMKRSGYEMVGVGIGSDAISGFISDHCVIQDASDLKHRLFEIFRKKLVA